MVQIRIGTLLQKRQRPGLNPRDTKEGCAERIARCGTLSQNGYGDHQSAPAGVAKFL